MDDITLYHWTSVINDHTHTAKRDMLGPNRLEEFGEKSYGTSKRIINLFFFYLVSLGTLGLQRDFGLAGGRMGAKLDRIQNSLHSQQTVSLQYTHIQYHQHTVHMQYTHIHTHIQLTNACKHTHTLTQTHRQINTHTAHSDLLFYECVDDR